MLEVKLRHRVVHDIKYDQRPLEEAVAGVS